MAINKGLKNCGANRDPLTGALGTHPVGTGVGAVLGGAAAGAAIGTVVGPVGTLAGAAVGAVVGGLAGRGVAESIDPTREDTCWRGNDSSRPDIASGSSGDDYGPAYGYGVNSYGEHAGRKFDDVESDLGRGSDRARASPSGMSVSGTAHGAAIGRAPLPASPCLCSAAPRSR